MRIVYYDLIKNTKQRKLASAYASSNFDPCQQYSKKKIVWWSARYSDQTVWTARRLCFYATTVEKYSTHLLIPTIWKNLKHGKEVSLTPDSYSNDQLMLFIRALSWSVPFKNQPISRRKVVRHCCFDLFLQCRLEAFSATNTSSTCQIRRDAMRTTSMLKNMRCQLSSTFVLRAEIFAAITTYEARPPLTVPSTLREKFNLKSATCLAMAMPIFADVEMKIVAYISIYSYD